MYRKICAVGLGALAAAAAFELGACADPDTVTVTMTCSPRGLHLGLMTLTGASCPVSPPGTDVYYAAFTWPTIIPLSAEAAAQLNATPSTLTCRTKIKSRAGGVADVFSGSAHTKFPSGSPNITFTSNNHEVVCVLTNSIIGKQSDAGGQLLLGGVWPVGTPVKTETFTCDPNREHHYGTLTTGFGIFCEGGEPTGGDIHTTRLTGWNAGHEDQLNSTTTTITCTTQNPSGARESEYGGALHVSGSPDITFTNALGTICILTNSVIAPLSFDPTKLVLGL
jgi:hypothetical protein